MREGERDCESLSYVVCVSKYVGTVVILYDFYLFPPDGCICCLLCATWLCCVLTCVHVEKHTGGQRVGV